jgi:hypothetical protein
VLLINKAALAQRYKIIKLPGTNKISGAEAVIRCLLAEGVDLVYGCPGGAIMPVYDDISLKMNSQHT